MFVDEGWELIRYKTAKRYIVRAGRTWRKKLGEIVLGSQSTAEWKEAGILPIIRELCPMAILLSNPNGNPTDYAEVFKLNEEELRLYGGLESGGRGLGEVIELFQGDSLTHRPPSALVLPGRSIQ
jgi:type IV secretory pathway VirB4 component